MNSVNKTLYIPLYGKSYVSQKGIILKDKQAELIWNQEGFELKGKAKSKYLAYFMAMRARVFDDWLKNKLDDDCVVLHLGCGMNSRYLRVHSDCQWYDIDFEDVIKERRRYYQESETYHMIGADLIESDWIHHIKKDKNVIVLIEGMSMYLKYSDLESLFSTLSHSFEHIDLLMDCYSEFGAKMSKYKNPINEVGVYKVYGLDEPEKLNNTGLCYSQSYNMTPDYLIDELEGMEHIVFKKLYSGHTAKKIYKLYEFIK